MKILCFPETPGAGVPFYRQFQILNYLKSKGHEVVVLPNLANNKKAIKDYKEQFMNADFVWLISPVGLLIREFVGMMIKDNMNEVVARYSGMPKKEFDKHRLNYKDLRFVVDFDDEPIVAMPQSDDYLHRGRKEVYINNPDGSVTPLWTKGVDYWGKVFSPETNYINIRSRIEILKMCHAMTSPSEVILKGFGRFNKTQSLLLLPNAVDLSKIQPFKRSTDGKLRILWSMGASHKFDFDECEDAFVKLMESDPRVMLVTWGQFYKSNKIPMERREHHNWIPNIEKYYAHFSHITADVGFCYVQNNRFNRCKSPIKAEEYMAARLPVVMSETLYSKTLDMSKALGVISRPEGIGHIARWYDRANIDKVTNAAYEYVKETFSLPVIGDYLERELLELTKRPLYPGLMKTLTDAVARTRIACIKDKKELLK